MVSGIHHVCFCCSNQAHETHRGHEVTTLCDNVLQTPAVKQLHGSLSSRTCFVRQKISPKKKYIDTVNGVIKSNNSTVFLGRKQHVTSMTLDGTGKRLTEKITEKAGICWDFITVSVLNRRWPTTGCVSTQTPAAGVEIHTHAHTPQSLLRQPFTVQLSFIATVPMMSACLMPVCPTPPHRNRQDVDESEAIDNMPRIYTLGNTWTQVEWVFRWCDVLYLASMRK